jgi:hypothetical protein
MPNCPGGLILHIVGYTVADCTYDDEPDVVPPATHDTKATRPTA